jgi:hypothetical protein
VVLMGRPAVAVVSLRGDREQLQIELEPLLVGAVDVLTDLDQFPVERAHDAAFRCEAGQTREPVKTQLQSGQVSVRASSRVARSRCACSSNERSPSRVQHRSSVANPWRCTLPA